LLISVAPHFRRGTLAKLIFTYVAINDKHRESYRSSVGFAQAGAIGAAWNPDCPTRSASGMAVGLSSPSAFIGGPGFQIWRVRIPDRSASGT
jgi:hypothetical protein